MKMNKIAVAVALWFAASASHASFVDNRQTDAVIEVNFKAIAVEDLVAEIVPPGFHANYSRAELRKKPLKVSGQGTWQQLLDMATVSTDVIVTIDLPGQRVHISDRVRSGSSPAPAVGSAKHGTVPVAPVVSADKLKRDWVLRADAHNTLEEALDEFAARVDFELIYEAREFALNLRRDITIARDADFWEALRVIGETYRKSDGAFQVLPTEFKQIVILPMGQNTVATQ